MGSLAIGIPAVYLACLLLAGERFDRRVAGVPLGIWLALAAIVSSFLVVVAFASASTKRLDPRLRQLKDDR